MEELLTAAEQQLTVLPASKGQPHWRDTLNRLDRARIGLENARAVWRTERDALHADAVPSTDGYDEPLAERNADAWSYLCDWADGGHVLNQIAKAAADHARHLAGPAAEHSRAPDPTTLPPQPPGHPRHRGPR
jgi:hypothetical protein